MKYPSPATADDFDDVAPDPSSMIESLRAAGYTLPTAVADLIDNSIAARANNVWLAFEWQGEHSWVRIADDGDGMMSEEVLVNAMRLGSRHPHDLPPVDVEFEPGREFVLPITWGARYSEPRV